MRVVLRILGGLLGLVLVVVLAGLVYAWVALPKSAPPPDIRVTGAPEQVARGRYLFHNVSTCVDCHGGLGQANVEEWLERAGFFPPNITPAALGDWSDGEIARAISSGVRKDGAALFPAMPYGVYRNLSRDDLAAVVAYVRTLEPLPVEHPRADLRFPLSLIARLSATPAEPRDRTPTPADGRAYGEYLVNVAGCAFCHTPFGGTPPRADETLRFAGGHVFPMGEWVVTSANITPDSATGIGSWSRERFIGRFRQAAVNPDTVRPRGAGPPSPMPWPDYAGMRPEDLGAIYDYLRSRDPIRHEVERYRRDQAP